MYRICLQEMSSGAGLLEHYLHLLQCDVTLEQCFNSREYSYTIFVKDSIPTCLFEVDCGHHHSFPLAYISSVVVLLI